MVAVVRASEAQLRLLVEISGRLSLIICLMCGGDELLAEVSRAVLDFKT